MNIGFIGLGAMGLPMAKNVAKAGHKLFTLVHRRKGPAEELVSMGAEILSTPAEIARRCEVVITIVPADAQLKDVAMGPDGLAEGLSAGKVVIDMTTATSITMEEVAKALAPTGALLLDAPVSGGTPKAASGELTIIVGGEKDVLEKCRPILETMGTNIYHVGKLGSGKVVKMVNQVMAAVHLLAIGEAFALGMKAGADPASMYDVIKDSSGYSRMMDLRLPGFLLDGKFEPGFKLDLMKKDVNLAVDSAKELNVPLFLGGVASQVFASASTAGAGEKDFSAAAQFLADLSGVKLSD